MSIVHKKVRLAAALSGLFAASVVLAASINPPTTPQTSPAMNAKEKANLDMVLDWWRLVIENGHLETTVQVPGRRLHSAQSESADGPGCVRRLLQERGEGAGEESDRREAAASAGRRGAKGDFVFLVFETEQKNPNDASQTYHQQFVRDSAHRERQGAGALGQREALEAAGRHAEAHVSSSQSRTPERGSMGTLTAEEKNAISISARWS